MKGYKGPSPSSSVHITVNENRVYSGRSRFRSVEIIDTGGFGRCLVLDGVFSRARETSLSITRPWSSLPRCPILVRVKC